MSSQLTLPDLGEPVPVKPRRAQRNIQHMRLVYGSDEAHVCGDCANFVRIKHHDKTYFKCNVYGISQSDATDWRMKWRACGIFIQKYEDGSSEGKSNLRNSHPSGNAERCAYEATDDLSDLVAIPLR